MDPPPDLPLVGAGTTLQARVCRERRKIRGGEDNAHAVGEAVPFLEYALHRQLLNKMKVRGLNGLFNLRVQVDTPYLTPCPWTIVPLDGSFT